MYGIFLSRRVPERKRILNQNSITLVLAAMREGEGKARKKTGVLDDNTVMTKLPLASRMATFIRETTFELETLNSELQIYNEHLQDVAKTDAFYKLNARGKMR